MVGMSSPQLAFHIVNRGIFSSIMTNKRGNESSVVKIVLADCTVFKSARLFKRLPPLNCPLVLMTDVLNLKCVITDDPNWNLFA